jgi:hypothetical protein
MEKAAMATAVKATNIIATAVIATDVMATDVIKKKPSRAIWALEGFPFYGRRAAGSA